MIKSLKKFFTIFPRIGKALGNWVKGLYKLPDLDRPKFREATTLCNAIYIVNGKKVFVPEDSVMYWGTDVKKGMKIN